MIFDMIWFDTDTDSDTDTDTINFTLVYYSLYTDYTNNW